MQVESNQRLVEKGVLAPIDIVAANTQVTTFEQNVYTAQESVTRAENTLKTLMLPDRTAPLWSRPLTPVTPVSLEAPRVPLEQAVSAALKSRPELAQLQTSAEINRIDTRYFRDLTKPQIDLVGTYTTVGLAGSLDDGEPEPAADERERAPARARQRIVRARRACRRSTRPRADVRRQPESGRRLHAVAREPDRPGLPDLPRRACASRCLCATARPKPTWGARSPKAAASRTNRAQAEQIIEADVRNATQALRSAEARLAVGRRDALFGRAAVRERAAAIPRGHDDRLPRLATADRAAGCAWSRASGADGPQ